MTSDQLVHRRIEQGKAYSVRYDQVNAMLLNEFLKEDRKWRNKVASLSTWREHGPATQGFRDGHYEV